MTNEVMYKAAELLRGVAKDPMETAAFVVAASCFQATCGLQPLTGKQRTPEEFKDALLRAAEMLAPICPHCEKAIGPETVSQAQEIQR